MLVGVVFILSVCAVFAVPVVFLIRNEKTYNYRRGVLADVGRAVKSDIAAGRPWYWRYEAFGSVSYNEMAWQPWRRFDSFYPDQSFRFAEEVAVA